MLPARVSGHEARVAAEPARTRRTWLGVALRIVRDAAIAVAVMASVPIMIVATRGDDVWSSSRFLTDARTRVERSEASRPLALPSDPSITPIRAGLAFHSLPSGRENPDFPQVTLTSRPEATWYNVPLEPGMFPGRAAKGLYGQSHLSVFEAVTTGFSPKELEYLRVLATSPVWREFDLVARAPAVDFIGGRFKVPFGNSATVEEMPVVSYKTSKEMAYAAVSRAAYHLATGQRDSAETILRSILSVGFALIDDGPMVVDRVIGNEVVGIGRDALRRFFTMTNDPRANSPAVAKPVSATSQRAPSDAEPSVDEMRKTLIARSMDPARSRAERFETLNMLSASSCTNVPELLFGRRPDVTAAFQHARQSLARYPSEQALLDLLSRQPTPDLAKAWGPVEYMAVSTASVAGVVLNNPRLASCSRIVSPFYKVRWVTDAFTR